MRGTGEEGAGPSIHDAATAAVEHKGSGGALDEGVAAKVGAHLGADFSGVRVHQDALATEASAAMGARAFAHGADVFLGAGESGSDLGLLAHELTHVAQQGAAGQRALQRKVEVGDANSPAEHEADAVAAAVTGGAAPATLLVDDGPVAPGQMLKSTFLAELRGAVTAAADAELGPVMSAMGCPYIDQYFRRYATRSAAEGEALLRRFAPGVRGVRDAHAMIPVVVERVRAGVAVWRDTGQAPPEIAAMEPGAAAAAGAAAGGAGGAQALRAPDGSETLTSLEAELGPGAALDGATASRMSGALGVDVSAARIHTGPVAAAKAAAADAVAFTVGPNIVMGASIPAAGTLEGDALLAHELAHTVQQADAARDPTARRQPIGGESATAEAHADGVVEEAAKAESGKTAADKASLASRLLSTMTTGLQLQRCSTGPRMSGTVSNTISDGPYGWTSRYGVELRGSECLTTLKVKLVPDAGVPATDVASVQTRARAAFRRIFDNKFDLTDTADGQVYALRTDVEFVERDEHETVALHAGSSRSDSGNWSVGRPDETFAHELGHLMGLRDEYIDPAVASRATAAGADVHTDHSIMGNYHGEGAAAAQVHERHGRTMATAIGGATGRTFTIASRP
ncbi:MAG: DUF4157 domain-containing protein [Kofleriaceae bacterium]